MGDIVTIYHNPRCSKSRETLALLYDRGLKPEIILYLHSPPSAKSMRNLLQKLGLTARELMRTTEQEYRDLGLDNKSFSEDRLIQAMIENPKLIERPIVVHNQKAVLGRPPENIEKLFNRK